MSDTKQIEQIPPVTITGAARKTYATAMRKWSGWPQARLSFAAPGEDSPAQIAVTNQIEKSFTVNADVLVLNPHRVLDNITPFRMRQEAVLTGVMLHEAAHARFSHWKARTPEDVPNFLHSDGTVPGPRTLELATLCEEARIEGLMVRGQQAYGANGLGWTMRASAAHLLPMTNLSNDPNQMVMDVVSSWVLRAGRIMSADVYPRPTWVKQFTDLLTDVLGDHCEMLPAGAYGAVTVRNTLVEMISWDGRMPTVADHPSNASAFNDEDEVPHTGPYMIDRAREILSILFPDMDEDSMPSLGGGCAACASPESDDQGDGEGLGHPAPADAGEEQGEGSGEDGSDSPSPLGARLAQIEVNSEIDTKQACAIETTKAPAEQSSIKATGGALGGWGSGGSGQGGWRSPDKNEREIQKGAERFLRGLINPSETSRTAISDSPAATVDPAALAEWRAAGSQSDPRFFRRTRRDIQPNPPVKIALLVDISGSMDVLQKPSALLSWALSAAALDLRNFAGRGAQVESTLIHWGDDVHVIQPNGGVLPGIREVRCDEGTTAMGAALAEVERQMPGFFTPPEKPEHRLLVQFTDWMLSSRGESEAIGGCVRAMAAGVNMLSVTPHGRTMTELMRVESLAANHPGKSFNIKYDRSKPGQVWETASTLLG